MRRSDVGLLVLIAALVIPVGMRSGTMEAVTFIAVIGPVLVCAILLGILFAILRAIGRGIRRIWARLRRAPPEEEIETETENWSDTPTQALARSGVPQPRFDLHLQEQNLSDEDLEPTQKATPALSATPLPQKRSPAPVSARSPTPAPTAAPAREATPAPLPEKVTGPAFVGTTPWGAATIPTSDGGRVIVVVMPVEDGRVYDKAPAFPEGMVRAVIVTSRQGKGALGGTRVARLAGLDHVYQVTQASPVDREVEAETIEVRTVGEGIEVDGVKLKADPLGLRATWPDGATAVIGDAIPMERIFRPDVGVLIGGFTWSSLGPAGPGVPRIVPVPGVIGSADPHELAEILSKRGVSVSISGPPRAEPLPEMPSEYDVVMQIVGGSLGEAERMAKRRLAADLDPARMGFQLGIVAWMRGDEEGSRGALEEAARAGVAEAAAVLASLLVAHRDPLALDYAREALDALPDEPMVLRTAVLVHLQMGDSNGASRILVERGSILADRDRRDLLQLMDRPFAPGPTGASTVSHRFPHHARFAASAAKTAIAEERTLEAEKLLRRAVELDPAEPEHVVELGAWLSRQGRDPDAIAVYSVAIDRGGLHEVLRFNRATCHVRAGELAEAIVDLQVCVDMVEGWHAARVNLTSALWGAGDREGAARELERLQAEGAPARWVDALAAQIMPETPETPETESGSE